MALACLSGSTRFYYVLRLKSGAKGINGYLYPADADIL